MSNAKQPQPVRRQPNALERISAPILLKLHRGPRWIFPVFTALLLLGGLFVTQPVFSAVMLAVLGLFLSWLVALSWSLLSWTARLVRVMVIIGVVMMIVGKFQNA